MLLVTTGPDQLAQDVDHLSQVGWTGTHQCRRIKGCSSHAQRTGPVRFGFAALLGRPINFKPASFFLSSASLPRLLLEKGLDQLAQSPRTSQIAVYSTLTVILVKRTSSCTIISLFTPPSNPSSSSTSAY